MTHHQVLQDFPSTSQVSLHRNIKVNQPSFVSGAENCVPLHTHTFYTI
jgi:hypothetical protein